MKSPIVTFEHQSNKLSVFGDQRELEETENYSKSGFTIPIESVYSIPRTLIDLQQGDEIDMHSLPLSSKPPPSSMWNVAEKGMILDPGFNHSQWNDFSKEWITEYQLLLFVNICRVFISEGCPQDPAIMKGLINKYKSNQELEIPQSKIRDVASWTKTTNFLYSEDFKLNGTHNRLQMKEEKQLKYRQEKTKQDDLIRKYILQKKYTLRSIAAATKTSYDYVRKINNEIHHPGRVAVPKREYIDLPPADEMQSFLYNLYLSRGYIANNWPQLADAYCDHFNKPKDQFRKSSIIRRLRKQFKLGSYRIKGKQSKPHTSVFLQKQALVAKVILTLIMENEGVLFFDQSSVDIHSFKKTAIGSHHMKPLKSLPDPNASLCLLSVISMDGFTAVQFSNSSAKTNDARQFLEHAVEKYSRYTNNEKPITVVMDNAAYQKTAYFKERLTSHNINVIYNVPASPFNNLVEDFFLGAKKFIRTELPWGKQALFDLLEKGIKDTVSKGYSWIWKRFIHNVEKKLSFLISAGLTTPFETGREPQQLRRRKPDVEDKLNSNRKVESDSIDDQFKWRKPKKRNLEPTGR